MATHLGLRRSRPVLLVLMTALALSACASDATGSIGAPTADTASEPSPEPSSSAEPTPSTPAPSDSPEPTGETGLVDAVDLCEELDRLVLARLTGLPLQDGTFDGAICTWEAKDGSGTLAMSFGKGENTARYIDEVQDLDIGEVVDLTGADDAAAVTITSGSGSNRITRVALVAKVGHERLTVILIGKDANLETAVELAELVTDA